MDGWAAACNPHPNPHPLHTQSHTKTEPITDAALKMRVFALSTLSSLTNGLTDRQTDEQSLYRAACPQLKTATLVWLALQVVQDKGSDGAG